MAATSATSVEHIFQMFGINHPTTRSGQGEGKFLEEGVQRFLGYPWGWSRRRDDRTSARVAYLMPGLGLGDNERGEPIEGGVIAAGA